jgi:hypothetical protein
MGTNISSNSTHFFPAKIRLLIQDRLKFRETLPQMSNISTFFYKDLYIENDVDQHYQVGPPHQLHNGCLIKGEHDGEQHDNKGCNFNGPHIADK